MRRARRGLILLLGIFALAFPALEAQEPPPTQRQLPDSAELVFEREVFSYPQFERRNPFVPLVGSAEGGPRFEDLILLGVVLSPNPDASVALFGSRGELQAVAQDPRQAQEQLPRTYRVRRGDVLGNVRVLEIQRTRVVVEVNEFGLTEQRVMELQRPGQGGLS